MFHWEIWCGKSGFEGCKWLGHFNARGVIQDIKRVNADAKSSTTTVEFQEWMPIRGLIRYKQQGK